MGKKYHRRKQEAGLHIKDSIDINSTLCNRKANTVRKSIFQENKMRFVRRVTRETRDTEYKCEELVVSDGDEDIAMVVRKPK